MLRILTFFIKIHTNEVEYYTTPNYHTVTDQIFVEI